MVIGVWYVLIEKTLEVVEGAGDGMLWDTVWSVGGRKVARIDARGKLGGRR